MSLKTAIQKLRSWDLRNENTNALILIFSCVAGCIAGFGAFILKWVIKFVSSHLHTLLGGTLRHGGLDFWLLLLPLVGILIAVAWQKWVARADMVHCTSKIVGYLNSKNYYIPAKFTYDPIAACGITLGFGGSAGAEGPVAFAGAAAASSLGRWLGLDAPKLRIMVGIGAGAGIAGIFKSPVAGVLFTLEVLRMDLGAANVIGLIMGCICASVTCYACTGTQVYMPYTQVPGLDVPAYWVMLLGVFCGIYALIYNRVTAVMRRFFSSRGRKWVSWVSGGVIAGIILFMFPAMYGEGYPVMTELINGDHSGVLASGWLATDDSDVGRFILVLALMLLLKALATVCSNSAGGVAGDFAPTLFAGTVAGTVFSMGIEALFGIHIPVSLCAMFAMAGTFAGIIHAPVMAIFLTTEITSAFNYIFPVTLCAAFAYLTVKLLHPAGRYIETHYDDLSSLFAARKPNIGS